MILRLLFPLTAVAVLFTNGVHADQRHSDLTATTTEPKPTFFELTAQSPTELPPSDGEHSEGARHSRWRQWLQSLDLSDQQMARIGEIYQQSRGETSSLRQQLREERERMYSLLTSDVDSDQIWQIHQNVQSLNQALENQRFEALLEVREVLTPEQRVQVAESLRQYRERRSHRQRQ